MNKDDKIEQIFGYSLHIDVVMLISYKTSYWITPHHEYLHTDLLDHPGFPLIA